MSDRQQTINVGGVILAVLVVALYWYVSWALVNIQVPQQNATNFAMVIGVVGNLVGMIIGWYFGSSSSNKAKDDIVATQAQAIAAQATKPPEATTP